MKRFLLKILFFGLPLSVPLVLYLLIDPFHVIYTYKNGINTKKKFQVVINQDFQTTELFLNNRKKYAYDSFIFGNSRSIFYRVASWKKHIDGTCFHFDASAETIYGIEKKLLFLDEQHVPLKHALLILDEGSLAETTNSKGHLFIKHPATSKESVLDFHLELFRGFFPVAAFAHSDLYFSKKVKPYMKKFGIAANNMKQDLKSNEMTYYVFDELLEKNPEQYYAGKRMLFAERKAKNKYAGKTVALSGKKAPDGFGQAVIFDEQKKMLQNISFILKKHGTHFKIIINPMYDQIRLNENDLNCLKKIFGKEQVYDFSGENRFTEDYRNYYEPLHYRPHLCDSIIKLIYRYKGEELKKVL